MYCEQNRRTFVQYYEYFLDRSDTYYSLCYPYSNEDVKIEDKDCASQEVASKSEGLTVIQDATKSRNVERDETIALSLSYDNDKA